MIRRDRESNGVDGIACKNADDGDTRSRMCTAAQSLREHLDRVSGLFSSEIRRRILGGSRGLFLRHLSVGFLPAYCGRPNFVSPCDNAVSEWKSALVLQPTSPPNAGENSSGNRHDSGCTERYCDVILRCNWLESGPWIVPSRSSYCDDINPLHSRD